MEYSNFTSKKEKLKWLILYNCNGKFAGMNLTEVISFKAVQFAFCFNQTNLDPKNCGSSLGAAKFNPSKSSTFQLTINLF
jgi:hypothetical protein